MSEKKGLFGWSSFIATWISILGALVGGYMALQTYQEEVAKMEDARVVQTFQLFEMFNSAQRLQARERLFAYTKTGAELNPNDVYVILDFYDALQICVERNLCDRDLAVRLFQSYAVPFWSELGEVIVNGRTESDPNFGSGLQWMASLPMPAPLSELPPTPADAVEAAPASADSDAPTP